ncbi:RDD family protein [Chitinophaga sp. GCM10012297]|uniref:RDD family protein n=1 Tax=Chitinophaga chungangae TaxID=2821488 RepID=A0ABS3YH17_9BACT|nr:RDD family protein [Chitinophaga chungangae]MBO9153976.1 RDD family protein [Chitinophaga chungangae]
MELNQEHLLGNEINLVQASHGKRFANNIIDVIVFYIISFLIGILLAIVFPDFVFFTENATGGQLLDALFSMLLYALVFGSFEALLKGKTPGKLITGTRAVNQDGTYISASTAFKRGFARVVPFEAFSALGTPCFPWHDKWTDTYVINEKESSLDREN